MNAPMELPRNTLTIADTMIRQDADSRYCLNDLHKAAGDEPRHRPSRWVENQQTQELAQEIGKAGIPAFVSVKGGTAPGTYVCKELVYAYAMWISPAFHLKVIRAYDAMVTAPQHLIPQSLPEALRLAADLADQKAKIEAQLAIAAPKVEAFERIADADGTMNPTVAAKALQVQPKKLFDFLREKHWIYRRPGGSGNVAYQDKIQAGFLTHKVTTVQRDDGTDKVVEQVLVTAKGLAKLSQAFGRPLAGA